MITQAIDENDWKIPQQVELAIKAIKFLEEAVTAIEKKT